MTRNHCIKCMNYIYELKADHLMKTVNKFLWKHEQSKYEEK